MFIGLFIYDVLCGFFYLAALACYIYSRGERTRPAASASSCVSVATHLRVDFERMAVTLPVIVLIYEVLRCPRFDAWKQLVRNNWPFAISGVLAGLLTVLYIYGKTMSPHTLATLYPYRPLYSWHNFVTNNARFVNQWLYLYHVFYTKGLLLVFPKAVLVLWVVVFIYAWMRRDRGLRLMACWVVIKPLPLAFFPARGGARLYLPLFGWAMIFGKVASDLITMISKLPILIGQGV